EREGGDAEGGGVPAGEAEVNELLNRLSGLSGQEKDGAGATFGASVTGLLSTPAGRPAVLAASLYPGRLPLTETLRSEPNGPVATIKFTIKEDEEDSGAKKAPAD